VTGLLRHPQVLLDAGSSSDLSRSKPFHSAALLEKPSKRNKNGRAEQQAEAGIEDLGVNAWIEGPVPETWIEEPVVETGIEEPVAETGIEPTSKARREPGAEARVEPVNSASHGSSHASSHALGLNLAGRHEPN
jgi:hypothetical protein